MMATLSSNVVLEWLLVRGELAHQKGFPYEYQDRDAISDFDSVRECVAEAGWVRVHEKLVIYGTACLSGRNT